MTKPFKQAMPIAITCLLFLAVACTKDSSFNKKDASAPGNITAEATIAVATTATGTDSVYVMQKCSDGQYREPVAQSALPGGINTYLDSNYAGYTFNKAFAIKDSSGTTVDYVVVIFYNDKPVALLFTNTGSFVKVLEQREHGDEDNSQGWHEGGRFDNRDGKHRDTIAISSLPTAIITYMTTNYPNDTLLKAAQWKDRDYIIISANNGLYATVFSNSGAFVSRKPLPQSHGKPQPVAQTALPATALTYLSATYPDYVFEKAFSVSTNGVVKGYVVLIDANLTKYVVAFDASGNFVGAIPVW